MPQLSRASLSEADQDRVITRNIYRLRLQAVLDTICDAQTEHLEPNVCEMAGICRQQLSLDEGSQLAPLFFTRYQAALKDSSDPDEPPCNYDPKIKHHDNIRNIHQWLDEWIHDFHPEGIPGTYIYSWEGIKAGDLFEAGDFNWCASSVALTVTNPDFWRYRWEDKGGLNPPKPHVKCIIENWVDGDDRLLRGEIKAIIKIMRARLWTKSVRSHYTAPVMLYSTMGPWHVRVLEAYFNGSKLVVRNTPLFDMRGKDAAVLENLTRWWYGHGIGNTEEPHVPTNTLLRETGVKESKLRAMGRLA